MPDYNAEAYNIDGCASVGGEPVPISQCNVDCYDGGYATADKIVSKRCSCSFQRQARDCKPNHACST